MTSTLHVSFDFYTSYMNTLRLHAKFSSQFFLVNLYNYWFEDMEVYEEERILILTKYSRIICFIYLEHSHHVDCANDANFGMSNVAGFELDKANK